MSGQMTPQAEADRLMAEWVKEYFARRSDGFATEDLDYWIEWAALPNVARGWEPSDAAEDAFERAYATHHGGGDLPDGGASAVDVAREERAWTYVGLSESQVVDLLARRGFMVDPDPAAPEWAR
ncbi:hypothetical protein JS562_51960 [Agrobacterium sp. S2]|nr:hypothetical protein [Agrobacterium sp. S2]